LVHDAQKEECSAALLAAEQDLVVMFTDLVGFSRIAATAGSRAAGALLSRVLGEQIEIVESSGGAVRNIMGDGIMASWTIARDSERAAVAARAVRAAFAIAAAMERHPSPLPGHGGLAARIGLHVGPALFGTIAAGHAAGRTLIGDTVNIAAKLEQARRTRGGAEAFGALRISDELYRELDAAQQSQFPRRATIRAAGRLLRLRSSVCSDAFPMAWNRCLDRLAELVEAA
jgi:class 3 adenylate cyclase